MEMYLDLPPHLRVPVAKLRTNSHSLRIETGRYNQPAALPPWWMDLLHGSVMMTQLRIFFSSANSTHPYMSYKSSQPTAVYWFISLCICMSNLDKWKFISSCNDNKLVYLHSKFVSVAFELRRNRIWCSILQSMNHIPLSLQNTMSQATQCIVHACCLFICIHAGPKVSIF